MTGEQASTLYVWVDLKKPIYKSLTTQLVKLTHNWKVSRAANIKTGCSLQSQASNHVFHTGNKGFARNKDICKPNHRMAGSAGLKFPQILQRAK